MEQIIKRMILTLFFLFVFSSMVMAVNTTIDTCLDPNTLQRIYYVDVCDGSTCSQINTSTVKNCQFGCDSSKNMCTLSGLSPYIYIFYAAMVYIIFFISFTNLINISNEPRLVMFIICVILFGFLAFNSFNIYEQSQTINLSLVALNFGFMLISLLYVIMHAYNMFKGGEPDSG